MQKKIRPAIEELFCLFHGKAGAALRAQPALFYLFLKTEKRRIIPIIPQPEFFRLLTPAIFWFSALSSGVSK